MQGDSGQLRLMGQHGGVYDAGLQKLRGGLLLSKYGSKYSITIYMYVYI